MVVIHACNPENEHGRTLTEVSLVARDNKKKAHMESV
jgi:hypothetical protein